MWPRWAGGNLSRLQKIVHVDAQIAEGLAGGVHGIPLRRKVTARLRGLWVNRSGHRAAHGQNMECDRCLHEARPRDVLAFQFLANRAAQVIRRTRVRGVENPVDCVIVHPITMRPLRPSGNHLPINIATRPSQRGPLAEANGRRLGVERANMMAQLGAVLLCLAVVAVIALRGC